MKKLFVIVLLLLAAQLQAQVRIGANDALATAEQFLKLQTPKDQPSLILNEVIESEQSGGSNLFVFAVKPQGFVIVSATNEVLAYSLNSDLPKRDALPDHISYWLDLYNEMTDYVIAHPETARKPSKSKDEVEPLVTSLWGQGCLHNEDCPPDANGPCGHVSAGCVAIAMAQVMYYHKQPIHGSGSTTYNLSGYGTLSANFESTTYRWGEMTDVLHESNPAVAQLISHCGISVKTNYSAHSSGASSTNAAAALRQYFSYPAASLTSRTNNLNDEDWTALIRDNLGNRLPVIYFGYSSVGGHAFVCDGYDNNGLFHFNFGWDGVADGYYTLDNPEGFIRSQAIIHGILPFNNLNINSDAHHIIYVASDGTGDGSSWAQATNDLQAALYKSHIEQASIWVMEGTYTSPIADEYAFRLMRNSRIYGGFKGDEPFDYDLAQRDFEAHPSILDGRGKQGVLIVSPYFESDSVVIDGFCIQNGAGRQGAGILLSNKTHVRNCKIHDNDAQTHCGGGVAVQSGSNTEGIVIEDCEIHNNKAKDGGGIYDHGGITVRRCQIHDNTANNNGGGMCIYNSPSISRCIHCSISNNSATNGGGVYCYNSSGKVWSCLINNNSAKKGGGCYFMGDISLNNCTIVNNEARGDFGGVFNSLSAATTLRNCIVWGNTSPGEVSQVAPSANYYHCAVQDSPSSFNSNFNASADNNGHNNEFYIKFVNPIATAGCKGRGGDWRLQSGSLCIDMGQTIDEQPLNDLDGNPRLKHRGVDLGAYETDYIGYFIDGFICEETPFAYNDTLIADAGFYSFPHHNQSTDSLVILRVRQDMAPTTYYSEVSMCDDKPFEFHGTYLYESGHYVAEIGCKTYELDLTINHIPKLKCSRDTIIDYGTFVELEVSGADAYLWSTGDTTARITFWPEQDVTFHVTGINEGGCTATASVNVHVNKEKNELMLFPNPANGEATVYMPDIIEVEVFNMVGERVERIKARRKPVKLNLSEYANGMYVVHVTQLTSHFYRKLLVKH